MKSKTQNRAKMIAGVFLSVLLCSCVSSTLDSDSLRAEAVGASRTAISTSEPMALDEVSTGEAKLPVAETNSVFDPEARETAVSEIRTKAANGMGEKTQIGAVPTPATERLTPQDQQTLAAELEQSASDSQINVSDAELAAKKRAMAELRRRAARHYSDALKEIEN